MSEAVEADPRAGGGRNLGGVISRRVTGADADLVGEYADIRRLRTDP
jgi:hypothetical protein